MTIPAEEAASALRDAEAAAGRATQARGYQGASGHLFVWGAVWAIGNAAGQFSDRLGSTAWMVLTLVGVVASTLIGRRQMGRARGGATRALLIACAIGGFGLGAQMVVPPLSLAQANALAGLSVGAVYMAMGASAGLRLAAIGAAVMVGVIVGWVFLRDWFFLWSAVVGGGGLILGGLWFRRV